MFKASAVANAVSTVLGVPLTWGILLVAEMGIGLGANSIPALRNGDWKSPIAQVAITILTAPWIGPSEGMAQWAVPLAALVLLLPFFLVSVWSERRVLEHMLPVTSSDAPPEGEINRRRVRAAVRDANVVSYAILALITLMALVWGIRHPGTSQVN